MPKRPTIASLQTEISELKESFRAKHNEVIDLREYKEQHQPLKDKAKELENDVQGLRHELNVSRDETNQVVFRLQDRLTYLRDIRDARANFSTATAVGAPPEAIEQLRIQLHSQMAGLLTLDLNEPDVEMIRARLQYHRPRSNGPAFFGSCMSEMPAPLLPPKSPSRPYGLA